MPDGKPLFENKRICLMMAYEFAVPKKNQTLLQATPKSFESQPSTAHKYLKRKYRGSI